MRGLATFLSLVFIVGGCRPTIPDATPSLPPASNPPGVDSGADRARIVVAHNNLRRKAGLEPLELSPLLSSAAQDHAEWMAETGRLTHSGPDGVAFVDRIKRTGYNMRTGGENIAYGQADIQTVMNQWAKSPGHRSNILGDRFCHVGAAVVVDAAGRNYWCVVLAEPWGISGDQSLPVASFLPSPLEDE